MLNHTVAPVPKYATGAKVCRKTVKSKRKSEKIEKTLDNIGLVCYNLYKFEYHKNDYDEDGRNEKLYRELPVGARQWRILPETYHF